MVKGGKAIPLTSNQIAENKKIAQDNAKISDKSKHKAIHKAGISKDHIIPGKGESWQVVEGKLNELYDMRFNPEISIMASIDYAVYNLKEFTKSYNDPKVMENDANKAKIMYLTHHLGLGDARKFMANTIKEEDTPVLGKDDKPRMYKGKPVVINGAETLLRAQFKGGNPPHPELADEWYKANDDNWIWAHRSWLCSLIDGKVKLENFACAGVDLPEADDLFDMIKTLGGKHPEGFVVTKPRN